MAYVDEHADILGGPILQNPNTGLWLYWSYIPFWIRLFLLASLGSLAVYCYLRIRETIIKYQELNYRKASRRKHGISDNDHRPFAVAYRAAMRARAEREAQERRASIGVEAPSKQQQQQQQQQPVSGPTRNAIGDAHSIIRQRLMNQDKPRLPPALRSSIPVTEPPRKRQVYFADDTPPSRRTPAMPAAWTSPQKQGGRHLARHNAAMTRDGIRPEKRSWTGEDDVNDGAKRSRVVSQPSFDDDDSRGSYERSDEQLARGSKRGLHVDGDDHDYSTRDKRRRNESVEEMDDGDEVTDMPMDEDEADQVSDLRAVSRGRKRDRAEAGSTFGGDEEEDGPYVNGKSSRQAKRRSLTQRKLEASQRGTKRDRNGWSPESEDEFEVKGKGRSRSHKKRGKRAQSPSEEVPSDVSMDSLVSTDPLCKGRKVGEQWESKGVQYKVADNGQRLRLTLVKKARSKYVMPEDSQHPDRNANMHVYVETWLTEEQYKDAEKRHDLVSQDAPQPSSASQASANASGSPAKVGKSLLWDLTKDSAVPKRSLRQSIASDVGLRANPFQQSPAVGGRRVGLSHIFPLNGALNSPTHFRSLSKWEKQEMEAAAMARIRERMRDEKPQPAAPPAPVPPSAAAPSSEVKPAPPAITFTAPTPSASITEFGKPENSVEAKPAEIKPPAGFSFGQTSATAQPKAENMPAIMPAPPSNFGIPAPSATTPAPSTLMFGVPPAKEQSAQPSPAPRSAGPAVTQQTSFAPAAAAPPTFSFGQPSKPSTPAASNPPALGFGAPTTATPAVTDSNAPKFSFGAPASTPASITPGSGEQKQLDAAPASQPPSAFGFPSSGAPKPTLGGFGKPPASGTTSAQAGNSTQPTSMFGAAAVTTPAAADNDKMDSSSPPKFNFGAVAPKAPAPTPNVESMSSMISAGASQDAAKQTTPVFSFNGAPATAAPKVTFGQQSSADKGKTAMAIEAKPAEADKPKFSFGQPGGMGTSSAPSPLGATATSSQSQPSGFSFGGGSTTNAFGSSDNKAKTSAPVSMFGAASNANKPDGQTAAATSGPSAFGFGSGAAPSAFGQTGASPATTPAAAFGQNGASAMTPTTAFGQTSTSAATTPTNAFGQNGASAMTMPTTAFGQTSTPGGTNAPTPATQAQNVFTFGAPKASPNTPAAAAPAANGFTFGASKPAADATKPSPFGAAPSAAMFTFGKQPESNTSTTNGSAAPTTPSSATTPFTFGKPSTAPTTFTFGAPSNGTSGGGMFTFGQQK